jgi:hypothetical protein
MLVVTTPMGGVAHAILKAMTPKTDGGVSMRKQIIEQVTGTTPSGEPGDWLDLDRASRVQVTSEDPARPIELALVLGDSLGWQAADPGEQIIRLLFDEASRLRRVRLVFREDCHGRTQEFVLLWSPDGGRSYEEIIRQQYTFSPPRTIREVEEYRVNLDGVTAFELRIVPDISGGNIRASLERMQLASTNSP